MRTSRRSFINKLGTAALALYAMPGIRVPDAGTSSATVSITNVLPDEDIFNYIKRTKGAFDINLYRQIIGAANPFKEGDLTVGVASPDETSRLNARKLISNTKVEALHQTPLYTDELQTLTWNSIDKNQFEQIRGCSIGQLKDIILTAPETEIKNIMHGFNSDLIACIVKLMSNDELIAASRKIFNPIPGTHIGAKGYMGARIQPNSPTDNIDEITWQIFDAWSFAVGDVVLGNNPVSSAVDSVAAIEKALYDLVVTFELQEVIPHSVLAHIDIQAEVEKLFPGTTGIWFQSLAGTVKANDTFDITVEKMMGYARQRTGQYGFYIETGQGADFTNGHGLGFDMVIHESRKYGFLRMLKQEIAKVQDKKRWPGPWVHLNDVAGFIGPEVFRTRDQLVRTCLEDTLMGKLHGLTIGLDICSTLHMDVSLDDLDWCITQVMPANPAYLMALPTKNDPMLGYLTTGYHDHLRIREQSGYKVNDTMWDFFKRIRVIDPNGKPTEHFGDPVWVYYLYRLAKKDTRSLDEIYAEGKKLVKKVQDQGVPLAIGSGANYWEMPAQLNKEIHQLYEDSKACIWAEMTAGFINSLPNHVHIKTMSKDRKDYVYHPESGEKLSAEADRQLTELANKRWGKEPDAQIVISDGLNANAIMDTGHLAPYLDELRKELARLHFTVADELVVITSGRVRAGYRCGETLFGRIADTGAPKAIIHIIGERPGTIHHNFSIYFTAPPVKTWKQKGKVDHNITKVVSGVSDTSLHPVDAAKETAAILSKMMAKGRIK